MVPLPPSLTLFWPVLSDTKQKRALGETVNSDLKS